MSKFRRRLMMMIGKAQEIIHDLPANYTKYDWIKCNRWRDGSYIDSGVANRETGIKLEMQLRIDVNDPGGAAIFGENGAWLHALYFPSKMCLRWVTKFNEYREYGNIQYGETYTIVCDDNSLNVNGIDCQNHSDNNNRTSGNNLRFLSKGTDNVDFPIFYYKLWVNGALVRYMVPCTNPNNEPGMYDLVSEAFFGNAGSGGSLVVGNN